MSEIDSRIKVLVQKIADEKDHEKVLALVLELERLLGDKGKTTSPGHCHEHF